MSYILKSQRVLFKDTIKPCEVVIEHDYITDILPYGTAVSPLDLGNSLIVPGFIDLHSDAVEKEVEPRPGADFPLDNALVELDKKLAMAGITTMFHAIAFNDESMVGQRANDSAARLIKTLSTANKQFLQIDNLSHARYEITSFSSIDIIKDLISAGHVQMLSLMDHSPGQGQFKSLEKWKQYHIPAFELSEADADKIVTLKEQNKDLCIEYIEEIANFAKRNDIIIASHDDDTVTKIDIMAELGIRIAEFPLNVETASHARSKNIATGMGAPNIVRGKSQSGNVSARELVEAGCCDFLCSDYYPSSMLQAVYALHTQLGLELPEAFSYVTHTPASVAQLEDRGSIETGKLADIAVIDDTIVPKTILTVKSGTPIYSSNQCLCIAKAA